MEKVVLHEFGVNVRNENAGKLNEWTEQEKNFLHRNGDDDDDNDDHLMWNRLT